MTGREKEFVGYLRLPLSNFLSFFNIEFSQVGNSQYQWGFLCDYDMLVNICFKYKCFNFLRNLIFIYLFIFLLNLKYSRFSFPLQNLKSFVTPEMLLVCVKLNVNAKNLNKFQRNSSGHAWSLHPFLCSNF